MKIDYVGDLRPPAVPYNLVLGCGSTGLHKGAVKELAVNAGAVIAHKAVEHDLQLDSDMAQNGKWTRFDGGLDTGLSNLQNDALTLVLGSDNQKLGESLTAVQIIQRYGANVQLVGPGRVSLVVPKGLTHLQFPAKVAYKLFPIHGKTYANVNGVEELLDFSGDVCEGTAKELKIDGDMPLLVCLTVLE